MNDHNQVFLTQPLRIGVVGLGTHAWRGHLDHAVGLFETVAVYDTNPGSVRIPKGAEIYDTYEEMLAHSDIEAVFIMSPDRYHAHQTRQAVDAGKHVFCEKPMATDASQMDMLTRTLERASGYGLVVSSCHPRRFDPPFTWLHAALPGLYEELGRAIRFEFDFFYHEPQRDKVGLHSGLLIDHVPHEVDTMSMLFGRRSFTADRIGDSQTSYCVAGLRDDGLQFLFSGTRMLTNGCYPETAMVRFARGVVRIDASWGIAEILDYQKRTRRTEQCGVTDYDRRFRAVNIDFAMAVRGEHPSYLDHGDLLLNTSSAIALSENGRYGG